MGATTPLFAIPYPVGTDRVMDGDDAMHSLAQRVEDRIGGTVAAATGPSVQMDLTTATQMFALTVNTIAGHRYRITAHGGGTQISANGGTTLTQLRQGGSEASRPFSVVNQPANSAIYGTAVVLFTAATSAAVTWSVWGQASAGGLRVSANTFSLFVEDLGVTP